MAYFPREGCCVLLFVFFPVRLFLTFLLIALQPIFLEMGQNMCVTGCLFFQHWQLCVSWRQKCLCSEEMLCPFGGNTTRFQQELEFTNGNWCNLIQTLLSFLFAQQCCAYEHAGLPKLVRTNIVLKLQSLQIGWLPAQLCRAAAVTGKRVVCFFMCLVS